MTKQIATDFANAFQEASGFHVGAFSNLIRFAAVMCVISGFIWTIHHFLHTEQKEQEGFLERMASRSIRLVIALVVFMTLLTTKGTQS